MDVEQRDFEIEWILRPACILSDGILSRRAKLRRDFEIEPKNRVSETKEQGVAELCA